jgi:hypothetical protein
LAGLICCGAALTAVGALSGHPLGVVALAAAFGIFQLATVVADTRLQGSISGPARATVTSLAGMSTDVATLAVYGSYAALVDVGGHGGAFALLALSYLAVAVLSRPVEDCEGCPALAGIRNVGLDTPSAGRPDSLCNFGGVGAWRRSRIHHRDHLRRPWQRHRRDRDPDRLEG